MDRELDHRHCAVIGSLEAKLRIMRGSAGIKSLLTIGDAIFV